MFPAEDKSDKEEIMALVSARLSVGAEVYREDQERAGLYLSISDGRQSCGKTRSCRALCILASEHADSASARM